MPGDPAAGRSRRRVHRRGREAGSVRLRRGRDDRGLRGALDLTLRRFAAYHDLQGAFGRRALTERAKAILMERCQVDERRAFAMLRGFSRTHGLKIIRVAQSVIDRDLLRKRVTREAAQALRRLS